MSSQPRWSEPEEPFDGSDEVEAALRNAIRPDPVLTVSQWADEYRILSTKLAAEAGRYRTSRAPFLRDVMDALSPTHPAERVVFMKSAQVGATEAGSNWLGYIIHWSPAPVMAIWPTVETAKKNSKQRVEALIEDCPELSRLVGRSKARDSDNTRLMKGFPGGVLVMTGANSGVGLRSTPARYAFCDEIDAYPGDVDGEGDPIALIANRTTTFGRSSKMFLVSTPTVQGQSRIEREFATSDQRRFFVPCPHCGAMQWLKFERLRWTEGRPETAAYLCEGEGCGSFIEERCKTEFMAAGAWRPTAVPKDPTCVGFHISGLYSPLGWFSWEKMAREWDAAQGDTAKLKSFKNTRLGETWFEHGERVGWEQIYERREPGKQFVVPQGGTLLFAAVYVQAGPARLELHLWAFGEGAESWMIEKRVFPGPAGDPRTWIGVEEALEETWTHASGAELRIERLAVDTGDQTTGVYAWIVKQDQSRVHAIKGRGGFELNAPVATPSYVPFGSRRKAVTLRMVSGAVFKAELYRSLALPRPTDEAIAETGYPPGYVHVPDYMDAEWCKQLTAEQRVRTKAGKWTWEPVHPRNEALDCWVYCRALLWTLGAASWRRERWQALRVARGLEGTDKKVAAAAMVPRSPREQAALARSGQRPAGKLAPGQPARSPREQARINRDGAAPPPPTPRAVPSWGDILRKP